MLKQRKNDEQLQGPYRRISVNGVTKPLHRKVLEDYLGRPLRADEHVHHINGNKLDNRIENLQIVSPSEHARLHAIGRIGPVYNNISVEAYTVDDELVYSFISLHAAGRAGFQRRCIKACIEGRQPMHAGFVWKRVPSIRVTKAKKEKPLRPRVLVTEAKSGKPVAIYNTPTDAHRLGGYNVAHVTECCNGIRRTHKGMCFRYIQPWENVPTITSA